MEQLGVVNEGFENEQVEGETQQKVDVTRKDVDVEVQVDWTAELPINVNVPKVDIHSLVMDFTSVAFVDVMSAKSLKLVGVHLNFCLAKVQNSIN